MLIVPLRPLPRQTLQVQLANQATTLDVYQLAFGLFMNVSLSGSLIVGGVICQNRNRIVRSAYLGFAGDFAFADTQGNADPVYTGLGARWLLCYLEEADVEALAA